MANYLLYRTLLNHWLSLQVFNLQLILKFTVTLVCVFHLNHNAILFWYYTGFYRVSSKSTDFHFFAGSYSIKWLPLNVIVTGSFVWSDIFRHETSTIDFFFVCFLFSQRLTAGGGRGGDRAGVAGRWCGRRLWAAAGRAGAPAIGSRRCPRCSRSATAARRRPRPPATRSASSAFHRFSPHSVVDSKSFLCVCVCVCVCVCPSVQHSRSKSGRTPHKFFKSTDI